MRMIRIAVLALVAAAAVLALVQRPLDMAGDGEPGSTATSGREPTASASPSMRTQPGVHRRPRPPAIVFPDRGTGRFRALPGHSATLGRSGRLLTFQVLVEGGISGLDRTELGRFVRATYAAANGWTAGGRWRFRHVGPGERPDFTLMLATPATRDRVCGGGYDRYTSCRIGDRIVLNIDRWVNGVPHYGAPLDTYRQYMINHETGHRLGQAHERCPSPGAPAPVMLQQTHALDGCTANPWPYLGGTRYRGPYAS
jgi:hypothetical protein